MKVNEENYIKELQKGRESALNFILDKYLPLVKGVSLKVLGTFKDDGLVEECINDVFLSIWKNAKSFRGDNIGDIEITLVSAVADKNKLEVSYEIKDKEGRLSKESQLASDISHFLRGQVYINEIDIMRSGGGDFKYIDNNTMLHSYSYNLPSIELGDELNINIKLNELLGKKGDFGFKFKLNTEKITENTIALKDIKVENPNIKINTLNKTPLSLVINAEVNGISDLVAIDNNGKPLKGGWVGYSGDTKENHFEYIPNDNMEWIEFIPVVEKFDKASEGTQEVLGKTIPLDFNFKDKKIELTDYRGAIINEVIKHDDYIVILHEKWAKEDFFWFADADLYLKDGDKIIKPHYFDNEEEYKQFKQYEKIGYALSFFKVDNFESLEIGIKHYDKYKFLPNDKFKVELKEKSK